MNKKCYFFDRPIQFQNKGFNKNELDYIKNTNDMLDYLEKKLSDLKYAINRFDLYANFRILRLLLFTKPRDKKMEKRYLEKYNKKEKEVLKYQDTPKRDKWL